MGIGERLKIALYANGMTIKKLHEVSGISLNTLYAITKRDSKSVDVAILDKISRATELPRVFFTSEQPFEDLELLHQFKSVIIAHIQDVGIDLLEGRSVYEISDIEFLRAVGECVKRVSRGERGYALSFELRDSASIIKERDEKYIDELIADTQEIAIWQQLDDQGRKLFSAFYDLNEKGQELAVDYVQLLAENEKYLK